MNLFSSTMSLMSRRTLEMTDTQEGEFIDDFLNDRIQEVGIISFHPLSRQIKIHGLKESQEKEYKIKDPSQQLIKFLWAAGDFKIKKNIHLYITQGN